MAEKNPFGNGSGAPPSGPLAKPTDFTKSPSSAARGGVSGASNFVQNPQGSGQEKQSVSDYTKTAGPTPRTEVAPNPQEIPAGGKTLYADPSKVSTQVAGQTDAGRKPFKLGK